MPKLSRVGQATEAQVEVPQAAACVEDRLQSPQTQFIVRAVNVPLMCDRRFRKLIVVLQMPSFDEIPKVPVGMDDMRS